MLRTLPASALIAWAAIGLLAGCSSNDPGPRAIFESTARRGPAPLTVQFFDRSNTGGQRIVSRAWSFGDGATSTDVNPVHTYAAAGAYNVTLTITTSAGEERTRTEIGHIVVGNPPDVASDGRENIGNAVPVEVPEPDSGTGG